MVAPMGKYPITVGAIIAQEGWICSETFLDFCKRWLVFEIEDIALVNKSYINCGGRIVSELKQALLKLKKEIERELVSVLMLGIHIGQAEDWEDFVINDSIYYLYYHFMPIPALSGSFPFPQSGKDICIDYELGEIYFFTQSFQSGDKEITLDIDWDKPIKIVDVILLMADYIT